MFTAEFFKMLGAYSGLIDTVILYILNLIRRRDTTAKKIIFKVLYVLGWIFIIPIAISIIGMILAMIK